MKKQFQQKGWQSECFLTGKTQFELAKGLKTKLKFLKVVMILAFKRWTSSKVGERVSEQILLLLKKHHRIFIPSQP